ncbi:hypothetical protein FNV43_RR13237 [Rhamnella rubrinervis]|uniref:Peptidase S8/S53 domain-containing protein n=1 Tax=Rhamnella rubrinervis TaxID=2594499 RepID=A0A8K0H0P1_9ROSA|nr:hypothetical protein FNV43_RR13237 [Rhamnella rubrinervis]
MGWACSQQVRLGHWAILTYYWATMPLEDALFSNRVVTTAGNYVEGASYFRYASGTARGVAPRSRVAMYTALWKESNYGSVIIYAIDCAIIDGVDVLSLSFPYRLPFHEDPIAVVTFSAMEKGIFVSTAAGNTGSQFQSLMNGIPWVLTVAAGLKRIGYKIVVCQEDDKINSLNHQVGYVSEAESVAGGALITNKSTALEFLLKTQFPATFLTNSKDGEIVKDYIKTESNPKASLEFNLTLVHTRPIPRVPIYSSRGPSEFCPAILKPLGFMAPKSYRGVTNGRNLFNNFKIVLGTSFACPHAMGLAAL